MKTIHRVLIANRGEIAVRIARTCRAMGLGTVAVYSDADVDAPHVSAADVAVHIGPSTPSQSYLRVDAILEAARRSGADAVHPGYGFLSENAAFAKAVQDAGLVWIGPPPAAIEVMGSKQRAKRIAIESGVPVVPGYEGDDQSNDRFVNEAARIGYPVLIKASAGGGGKGMRIVRVPGELPEALDSARRIAEKSFSDGTLLIEKYVENPRHIEIQILGDSHGNLVHLFERECSIQRRHQKIIEESPSPILSPELRETMGAAAVALGRAIHYANAGTCEFILGPDNAFYFLEVNTRLQVEHPVTEAVTGVDLVREQIRVARGEYLGYVQSELRTTGAAIECRIYAEDPAAGFLPSTGTLRTWQLEPGDGVRIDAGVVQGSEVSVHYDPMLAKLITHATTRDEAIARMDRLLRTMQVSGVRTNREFLLDVIRHPAFVAGDTNTHFIDTHLPAWSAPKPSANAVRSALFAAALHTAERARQQNQLLPAIRPAFRNNPWRDRQVSLAIDDDTFSVSWGALGDGRWRVALNGETPALWRVLGADAESLTAADENGIRRRFALTRSGDITAVLLDGIALDIRHLPRFPEPGDSAVEGGCAAPMPGAVVRVAVAIGDNVTKGQTLMVLEAMKMEHTLSAPTDGVVTELRAKVGDQVEAGAVLVVLETTPP